MAKRQEKKVFNIFNKTLSKEIEAIKKLQYNQINWYDLGNEVDKINPNLNKYERDYLIYRFNEIFTFNNEKVRFDDQDIVMYKVLEEVLNYSYNSTPIKDLKEKEYSIDSGINNAFSNTKDMLSLFDIIKEEVIGINNQKGLYVDVDKWFENSKYKILDYEVLQKLSTIITAYIKFGYFSEFNIQQLFSKISEIIEYALLPSVLHNKFLDLENEVVIAINDNEQISIEVKDKDSFKNIEVQPIKISYKDGKKILIYKNIDTDTIEEVELFKCSLETVNETTPQTFNIDIKTYTSEDKQIKQTPIIKEINLFLECDSVVYEYFKMLPLSNMTIYDSEDKQIEFMKKYNYDCISNKFYIEATDYKEKCVSVIFHCLEHIKIIEPTSLNSDILETMNSFAKRNKIDLVKKETPPPPKTKEENSSSSKETNVDSNEDIEIDTKGLVQKIKDDKLGDINF